MSSTSGETEELYGLVAGESGPKIRQDVLVIFPQL